MKTNNWLQHLLVIIISLLPIAYLAYVWPSVPATVPTHFDGNFQPNDYSSRTTLWIIGLLISGVEIGAYFALQYLHLIDPKRAAGLPNSVFRKISAGIIFFLTIINFICLYASTGHPDVMKHSLIPIEGLFFAFLGNFMNNIRPNYFVGFRVPWTLSSDENWRRTHHIAGKLFFAGGIFIAVTSIFIHGETLMHLVFGTILVITIIPAGFSFWYFRKMQKNGMGSHND